MTSTKRNNRNQGLLQAFKQYQKRYLAVGKKPNLFQLFPEIILRTMRLEGEKVSRKQVQSLFR